MLNLLKFSVSLSVIASLLLVSSCGDVGPVPDFEYTYSFEPDMSIPDTASLVVGNIEFTSGSIDDSGMSTLSSAMSSAATATFYASEINSALNTSLQSYWSSQSRVSIENGIAANQSTIISQIESTFSAFQNSSSLKSLLPVTNNPSGSTSNARNGARIGSTREALSTGEILSTQQDGLDDCKQAAQEAYDNGLAFADSVLELSLSMIEEAYNSRILIIQAKEAEPESEINSNNQARAQSYLDSYNNNENSITTLFANSEITNTERDQLQLLNLVVYALFLKASADLTEAETILVAQLGDDLLSNLNDARDELNNQTNSDYNAALQELLQAYNKARSACHNQGGVNS